ncbi:MAG: N-acetylmuramoyl-L-alanine amidase, partial [Clostridia bacterium]|nr:N-acetylmuramoyl-L-alanine amidase [Clostridia bacterium]
SVDESASGTESLVYRLNSTAADIGSVIARTVSQRTGLRNRGVKARPGLYVLRRTNMPAVLVELGFITNPDDAAIMASSPNLFADALYAALRSYYGV